MTKKKPGAKMGQPPKPPEERRSVRVNFMARLDEQQSYVDAAKKAGVPVAEWIRRVLNQAVGQSKKK